MSDRQLAPYFNLTDVQSYVKVIMRERGFDNGREAGNITKRFMLLSGEAGEFAKAICSAIGMKHADGNILSGRADMCTMLKIDLDQAVRNKEAANKQRT